MATNGLVILTQPLSSLRRQIPSLLDRVSSFISDTVYIHVQPALCNSAWQSFLTPLECTSELHLFVSDMYSHVHSSSHCQNLDVRFLLGHVTNQTSVVPHPYNLQKPLSLLLTDTPWMLENWYNDKCLVLQQLKQVVSKNITDGLKMHSLIEDIDLWSENMSQEMLSTPLATYSKVVCGGTFDRLHSGHRLLLSLCCLLCEQELTIGITDKNMLKKKILNELIQPLEERTVSVVDYVKDVKPEIGVNAVPITDIYGPTVTQSDLQCIVVSQETVAGGAMVNAEREKRGFTPLEIVVVNLVDDTFHGPEEEDKVSSSSKRRRLLGELLQKPNPKATIVSKPYRIGLTGGIASGKSNVCSELQQLGAGIINCDHLGHRVYEKGTVAFHTIVEEFGSSIVTDSGEIDRKKLGAIVFSDMAKLDKLNQIVWPEIIKLAEEEIKNLASGHSVVVLEAALLLEAGWDQHVHEVWTTFVPREEAISRICQRNNLTESEASQRIDSQLSNVDRIAKSNVVFCPLWEYDYTRKQIVKAWDLLQQRLQQQNQ